MATPSYDAIRQAAGSTFDSHAMSKLINDSYNEGFLPIGEPIRHNRVANIGINPCSEIFITNNTVSLDEISKTTIAADKITINNGALATRANSMSYSKYKQDSNQDHEKITWTIEVPGVPLEDIEVYTVDPTDESATARRLFVKVRDTELDRFLNAGEKIASTTLELGVLTIVIDRPFKRQVIEVK
jgi:HSP20 family molecular chaperone IbpA